MLGKARSSAQARLTIPGSARLPGTAVLLAALCGGVLAAPTPARAQTIENGSFELGAPVPDVPGHLLLGSGSSSLDGWTVESGSIDVVGEILWQIADGTRCVDLAGSGPGAIRQDVETEVGVEYTLLFDLASSPGSPPAIKLMRLSAGDSSRVYLASSTGHDASDLGWRTRDFSFVAESTTTTILFEQESDSAYGMALDNVRFGTRPEDAPPTLFEARGPLGGNPTIGENAEVFIAQSAVNFVADKRIWTTTFDWQGPDVLLKDDPDYFFGWNDVSLGGARQLAATMADLDGDGHLSPLWAMSYGPDGDVYLKVEEGELDTLFLPHLLHPQANPLLYSQRSDRVLHLATGQLDEDPNDEAVLALWASDDTIRIYVIDDEGLTLQAEGSEIPVMDPAALVVTQAPYNEAEPRSAIFALALGDFDGDTQDEIAIVRPYGFKTEEPLPGVPQNLGLQSMLVELFEYEPADASDLVVVGDPAYGQRTGGIEAAGGGEYTALTCDPALSPCGPNVSDLSRTRLNHVMARSANLTPDDSSLLGYPSEHLVVAAQTLQFSQCAGGCSNGTQRPSYMHRLHFTRECGGGGASTEAMCIDEQSVTPLARAIGAAEPAGITTTATAHDRSSAMCFDTGNLDSSTAAADIVMLNDAQLSVYRFVPGPGGGTLALLGDDPASRAVYFHGAARTHQAGNHWHSQCHLALTDLNAGDAGTWAPEVAVSYQTIWRQDRGFPHDDETWFKNYTMVWEPVRNADGTLAEEGPKFSALGASHIGGDADVGSGGHAFLPSRIMAVGDRDGDRVRLGEPVHVRRSFMVPQVIVNSPPVHLEPQPPGLPFDLNDCFEAECWNTVSRTGFAAGYEFDIGQQSSVGTTYKSAWQISAALETESSGTIKAFSASVKHKFETSYVRNFERTESQNEGFHSRQTIFKTSDRGDTVKALVTAYDVWEYPILARFDALEPGFEESDATVLVVVPDRSAITSIPALLRPGEVEAPFFWMTHEAGNLLSYKTPDYFLERSCGPGAIPTEQNPTIEPACDEGLMGRVYTSFVPTPDRRQISASDGAGKVSLTLTEGASSFRQSGSIFSFNHSTTVGGGFDAGIAKSSANLTIGSKYTSENISTQSTSLTESETLWTQLRYLRNGYNTSRYAIVPFLLMHNGAFVLDYGVDFDTDINDPDVDLPAGSIFAPYKQKPDLAVRLPYLRDGLKDLPLDFELQAYRTPEILLLPISNPDKPDNPNPVVKPGAIVEIQTRVHNYSLKPTAGGEVFVLSYDTPFAEEEIFSMELPSIEAQGTSDIISVEWQIPGVSMEEFDQMRLLVDVDPDDLVAEVHEDNNWGWRPLTSSYAVPEPGLGMAQLVTLLALAAIRRGRRGVA